MKLYNFSQYAIVVSCALVFAGAAHAQNCSGYDVLVGQSAETIDLGKGHTLTVVRNLSMLVNDDPKARDHLTVGECNGTFLSLPNGQSKGSGHCARKDKDGDTYSLSGQLRRAQRGALGKASLALENSLAKETIRAGGRMWRPMEKYSRQSGVEPASGNANAESK